MSLSEAQRASLESLTRQKPVVLFMKGNRQFPQCGFSATVVGILDKLTSGYATVNILQDPAVRDGMKEYSNWPTFPQLYEEGRASWAGATSCKAMNVGASSQKLVEGARDGASVGLGAACPLARRTDDQRRGATRSRAALADRRKR